MKKDSLRLVVHVDGGAHGNPGPAGAGVVVQAGDDGTVLYEGAVFIGRATNNVAEYHGLLAGLAAARRLNADQVEIASDSQLMVRQMTGQYRVKNAALKRLFEQARKLVGQFDECSFRHIPREENAQADALTKQAINLRQNVGDAEATA
ncbi:MAG: ribonuclease HI family protein [Phycisphaerae bacterium]|nr:ribonuclease HI family protein [Phycisphaerae bacterium]